MKCEICNDNKTVIVHGLLDTPLEIPCSCTCDKILTSIPLNQSVPSNI